MKKRATLKKTTPKVSTKKSIKKATKKSIKPSKGIKRTKATKRTRKPAAKKAKAKAKTVSTELAEAPDKPKMGRPTLYTEALVQHAERLLNDGTSEVRTARLIGINPSTWADWKKKYQQFSERVARAKDAGVGAKLDTLNKLSDQTKDLGVSLRATELWLRTRAPEEFGKGAGSGEGGTVVIQQQNVILAAGAMLEDALRVLDTNGANHYKVGHAEGEAHVAAKRIKAQVDDVE